MEEDVVTLEELKAQMNVDYDDEVNDAYITRLGRAATSSIIRRTRRTQEELTAIGGGTFPEELRLAIVQLAAHWYRVRETVSGTSQAAVPFSLDFLVKPYTRLVKDSQ